MASFALNVSKWVAKANGRMDLARPPYLSPALQDRGKAQIPVSIPYLAFFQGG